MRGFKSRKEGYTASSWERSGKEDFLPQTSQRSEEEQRSTSTKRDSREQKRCIQSLDVRILHLCFFIGNDLGKRMNGEGKRNTRQESGQESLVQWQSCNRRQKGWTASRKEKNKIALKKNGRRDEFIPHQRDCSGSYSICT